MASRKPAAAGGGRGGPGAGQAGGAGASKAPRGDDPFSLTFTTAIADEDVDINDAELNAELNAMISAEARAGGHAAGGAMALEHAGLCDDELEEGADGGDGVGGDAADGDGEDLLAELNESSAAKKPRGGATPPQARAAGV